MICQKLYWCTFVTNNSNWWLCIEKNSSFQKNKFPYDKNVFAKVFDELAEATRWVRDLKKVSIDDAIVEVLHFVLMNAQYLE